MSIYYLVTCYGRDLYLVSDLFLQRPIYGQIDLRPDGRSHIRPLSREMTYLQMTLWEPTGMTRLKKDAIDHAGWRIFVSRLVWSTQLGEYSNWVLPRVIINVVHPFIHVLGRWSITQPPLSTSCKAEQILSTSSTMSHIFLATLSSCWLQQLRL